MRNSWCLHKLAEELNCIGDVWPRMGQEIEFPHHTSIRRRIIKKGHPCMQKVQCYVGKE